MTPTLDTLRAELRRLATATIGDEFYGGWGDQADWQETMGKDGRLIGECSPEAILSLLDHIDALERDARRYRWLRKEIVMGPLTIAKADSWDLHPWSGDTPDELIDAALAEQGEPG